MQDSLKHRIGRYALALTCGVLAFLGMDAVTALVSDFAIQPVATVDAAEAQAASDQFLIFLNSMHALSALVAYAVWGFVLRRDAVLPGIVLYFMQAGFAAWTLKEIMLVVDPNATIASVVLQNWGGWLMSFFACVAGILLGQYVYQKRFANPSGRATPVASQH
ncbi:MAG: hypothetical protein AAAFM81_10345 [Pseudomonadota bacterium]